jgi:hypothetical protein
MGKDEAHGHAVKLVALFRAALPLMEDEPELAPKIEEKMLIAIGVSPIEVIFEAFKIMEAEKPSGFEYAEPDFVTDAGDKLYNVHDQAVCAGSPCVIHAPIQGEAWSDWPTRWRSDRRFMERACPCGVGHPAAEDVLRGRDIGTHGCCGIHPCSLSQTFRDWWRNEGRP